MRAIESNALRSLGMTKMKKIGATTALMTVIMLTGCESMNGPATTSAPGNTYPGSVNTGGVYSGYGVVQSVELVQQAAAGNAGIGGSGVGIGTIAGAVVGGVLGNQVGGGTGRSVATVAGAVGGAYVGHELENRQQQSSVDMHRMIIRMDNGGIQTLTQSATSNIRVGDRVQIENGVARRP